MATTTDLAQETNGARERELEELLERHREFERLILDSVTAFGEALAEELDECIVDTLDRLSDFLGADIGYLCDFNPEQQSCHCTHVWQSPSAKQNLTQEILTAVPLGPETSPYLAQQLQANRAVIIQDLDQLPSEAAAERARLQTLNIRAKVDVPRTLGGNVNGYLGFAAGNPGRAWSPQGLTLLRLIGQLMTTARENQHSSTKQSEQSRQLKNLAEQETQARRHSELQIEKIFQLAPFPMALSTIDPPKIVDVNQRLVEVLGYGHEKLIALDMEHIRNIWVHPEQRKELVDDLKRQGRVFNREFKFRTRSGSELVLLTSSALIRIGGVDHLLIMGNDITEKKRIEEGQRELDSRLQEAHKLESLGILAGGIAHDFNNLLMAILGNADLLKHDLPSKSPLSTSANEIITAAKRAADLARQMLAYSGKGNFLMEQTDLSALVEEMTPRLRASIPDRIALQINLHNNLPTIETDPNQVRQMIEYLVTNAAEAVGADVSGVITLKTGVKDCDRDYLANSQVPPQVDYGEFVFLEVRDTGGGIDDATREKLFDPFFTTKFTGRGLGLAATLGIVRSHRGGILVNSQPEQGTSFEILFSPFVAEGTPSIPPTPVAETVAVERVLFVDDEDHVRSVACRLLEKAGYEVDSASGGHKAIELFESRGGSYKCVILDLSMPDMSGEETLNRLLEINPRARVILSSGFSREDALSRVGDQTIAGFLHKPYDYQTLTEIILKSVDED